MSSAKFETLQSELTIIDDNIITTNGKTAKDKYHLVYVPEPLTTEGELGRTGKTRINITILQGSGIQSDFYMGIMGEETKMDIINKVEYSEHVPLTILQRELGRTIDKQNFQSKRTDFCGFGIMGNVFANGNYVKNMADYQFTKIANEMQVLSVEYDGVANSFSFIDNILPSKQPITVRHGPAPKYFVFAIRGTGSAQTYKIDFGYHEKELPMYENLNPALCVDHHEEDNAIEIVGRDQHVVHCNTTKEYDTFFIRTQEALPLDKISYWRVHINTNIVSKNGNCLGLGIVPTGADLGTSQRKNYFCGWMSTIDGKTNQKGMGPAERPIRGPAFSMDSVLYFKYDPSLRVLSIRDSQKRTLSVFCHTTSTVHPAFQVVNEQSIAVVASNKTAYHNASQAIGAVGTTTSIYAPNQGSLDNVKLHIDGDEPDNLEFSSERGQKENTATVRYMNPSEVKIFAIKSVTELPSTQVSYFKAFIKNNPVKEKKAAGRSHGIPLKIGIIDDSNTDTDPSLANITKFYGWSGMTYYECGRQVLQNQQLRGVQFDNQFKFGTKSVIYFRYEPLRKRLMMKIPRLSTLDYFSCYTPSISHAKVAIELCSAGQSVCLFKSIQNEFDSAPYSLDYKKNPDNANSLLNVGTLTSSKLVNLNNPNIYITGGFNNMALCMNGKQGPSSSPYGHQFCCSREPLPKGQISYWKVYISTNGVEGNTSAASKWLFLGLIGNTAANDLSYCDPSTYGWSSNNMVYMHGIAKPKFGGWDNPTYDFQQGDICYFAFNPEKQTMSFKNPRISNERQFAVHCPYFSNDDAEAYIHINFNFEDQSVVLLRSSEEEYMVASNELIDTSKMDFKTFIGQPHKVRAVFDMDGNRLE